MFSPEDALPPHKRARSNLPGSDASEGPFFNGVDFSDTLGGHTDGLVFGLEDNDFADCMLPMLFDRSPDNVAKLNSSPSPGAATRLAATHSSPPLPAPLPAFISLPSPASRPGSSGTNQPHLPPAPASGPDGPAHPASIHRLPTAHIAQAGAFIPTPAAATCGPAATTAGSAALPRPPSSSTLASGLAAAGEARPRAAPSRPWPGSSGRAAAAGPGATRLGSGSVSGSALRSGSGPVGGGAECGSPRRGAQGAPRTAPPAAAAGPKAGGWVGGLSFSGLDSDEDEGAGGRAAGTRSAGSPGLRRSGYTAAAAVTTTVPAAAAGGPGGAAAAASSNLLLRVFNGAMRPEVAALAAAAAQRALVTSPSVRPGLYFSEPEQSAGGGGGDAGRAAAKATSSKRGGKDRQGLAGGAAAAPAPTALPLAKYYPEVDAELMAALYGKRPLPRRVRVETISDRCHPCFRNPFEGLAGVKERRKLVAAGPLPEGALLGAYTGELRSGKMDERLVGGDLSGAEGLKAAFTLTLLDDLETRASEQEVVAPNNAPARDSLVVVGDPATCPLAEANAPRFWGPCSRLRPGSGSGSGSAGEGDRQHECNCRAYRDRADNAAVIPCVLKIRLTRLRSSVDAAGAGGSSGGGEGAADAAKGLEVLRAAAAAVAPLTSHSSVAAAPSASAMSGARGGVGGGGGGGSAVAAGGAVPDDPDKSTYVYGIVTLVVTSTDLKEGEEVLLRWDSDDSFFAVAEQNLRQYLFIRGLTAERDAAEAKAAEHRRQLALLRKAHRESQAAREAAVQRRDEAVQQKEAAERSLEEVVRQRDEAIRQRDEAADDMRGQRAAAAAVAAAAGPRVNRLEAQVAKLQAERDELAGRLEQLQRSQHHQPQQRLQRGALKDDEERRGPHAPPSGRQQHSEQLLPPPQQQQQQQQQQAGVDPAESLQRRSDAAWSLPMPLGLQQPPQKRLRLEDGSKSGDDNAQPNNHEVQLLPTGAAEKAAPGTNLQQSAPGCGNGGGDSDGEEEEGLDAAKAAEVLRRYADAKRQHDAAAAELGAALAAREAPGRRRAARLEVKLAAARREAAEAAGRLAEVQRELEASRLRATQLEKQLLGSGSSGGGGGGGGSGCGDGGASGDGVRK